MGAMLNNCNVAGAKAATDDRVSKNQVEGSDYFLKKQLLTL